MKHLYLILLFIGFGIYGQSSNSDESATELEKCANAYNLKQFKLAIEHCDNAVKLNPKNTNAIEIRGWVKVNLYEYNEAIKDFNLALTLIPNSDQLHFKKGYTYFYLKEFEQAVLSFDEAIKINPKYINSYFFRGKTLNKMNLLERAQKDFEICLKADPDWVDALVESAIIFSKKKEYKTAFDLFSRIITLDSKNAFSFYNRGVIGLTILKEGSNYQVTGCNDLKSAAELGYQNATSAYQELCKQ